MSNNGNCFPFFSHRRNSAGADDRLLHYTSLYTSFYNTSYTLHYTLYNTTRFNISTNTIMIQPDIIQHSNSTLDHSSVMLINYIGILINNKSRDRERYSNCFKLFTHDSHSKYSKDTRGLWLTWRHTWRAYIYRHIWLSLGFTLGITLDVTLVITLGCSYTEHYFVLPVSRV